ncbi:hypothetical protein MAPG_10166 [Magnaporthiopsis poae ATCC 64411]|uniref:Uncharacterized protein n=1 Tax=Magnaporthiopsis poae (strain ATCC 64411 / 73-15) TaxID=644358 RepID=A0A0C4EBV7_MAGP6|nr:hypothetical protein MAPG_10166 [Magnaporthiopsis poae ATCC 64411]
MLEVGPKFVGIYKYSKQGGQDVAELLASRGATRTAARDGEVKEGKPAFEHRLEGWHDGIGKASNWGVEDEDSTFPNVDRWLFGQQEYLDWRREHFPQLPVSPPL